MMAFAAAEFTLAEFWPRNCINPGHRRDQIRNNTIGNVSFLFGWSTHLRRGEQLTHAARSSLLLSLLIPRLLVSEVCV